MVKVRGYRGPTPGGQRDVAGARCTARSGASTRAGSSWSAPGSSRPPATTRSRPGHMLRSRRPGAASVTSADAGSQIQAGAAARFPGQPGTGARRTARRISSSPRRAPTRPSWVRRTRRRSPKAPGPPRRPFRSDPGLQRRDHGPRTCATGHEPASPRSRPGPSRSRSTCARRGLRHRLRADRHPEEPRRGPGTGRPDRHRAVRTGARASRRTGRPPHRGTATWRPNGALLPQPDLLQGGDGAIRRLVAARMRARHRDDSFRRSAARPFRSTWRPGSRIWPRPETDQAGVARAAHRVSLEYPPYVDAPIWQSNLKDADITLPEGLMLAPAGGYGLEACTFGAVRGGHARASRLSKDPPTCPEGSEIGTLERDEPGARLPARRQGVLRGSRERSRAARSAASPWKLFLLIEGAGLRIKLVGDVTVGEDGQIRNVFTNQPEVPFTRLDVNLRGGDQRDPPEPGGLWDPQGPATSLAGTAWARAIRHPRRSRARCRRHGRLRPTRGRSRPWSTRLRASREGGRELDLEDRGRARRRPAEPQEPAPVLPAGCGRQPRGRAAVPARAGARRQLPRRHPHRHGPQHGRDRRQLTLTVPGRAVPLRGDPARRRGLDRRARSGEGRPDRPRPGRADEPRLPARVRQRPGGRLRPRSRRDPPGACRCRSAGSRSSSTGPASS